MSTKFLKNQHGFSLLEILVAFSILALSLGLILKIFSSGLQTASLAENYTLAVEIADSLLAQTGIEQPLTLGETQGIENNQFKWAVKITATELEMSAQLPEMIRDKIVNVEVIVSWGQDHRPRSVRLTTLKIIPPHS